jgi:predicted nucleotidyltransferase
MKRDEVLRILAAHEPYLRERFGVGSLSLFGSVARDEATELSDVDLLVEFGRPTGYFGLIALEEYLEGLLGRKVDVGTAESLKPRLRSRVLGECVHVA